MEKEKAKKLNKYNKYNSFIKDVIEELQTKGWSCVYNEEQLATVKEIMEVDVVSEGKMGINIKLASRYCGMPSRKVA